VANPKSLKFQMTNIPSLLAIMLGRLRLSIEECINEYENLGKLVFGRPNQLASRNKYSAENFASIIKGLLKRKRNSPNLFIQDNHFSEGLEGCKVYSTF
jgi:hypothetical protein